MTNINELLARGYAETMDEWWQLLDYDWKDIIYFAQVFDLDDHIRALETHRANHHAPKLYNTLSDIWEALPDSRAIQRFKGFRVLCNLCSDFPYKK
jgi:hypothetical protein